MNDLYLAMSTEMLLTYSLNLYKNVYISLCSILESENQVASQSKIFVPIDFNLLKQKYDPVCISLKKITSALDDLEFTGESEYDLHLSVCRKTCELSQSVLDAKFVYLDGLISKANGKKYSVFRYRKDIKRFEALADEWIAYMNGKKWFYTYKELRSLVDSVMLDEIEKDLFS